ncbi:hypothetical protein [Nocardioides flavus (ex Wang et al. 2016)]|uniref:hypothetical protein n=1 Tax=Nocardioides flavus (ex Wang et al. 2016) TaxID=2058780 RepID=UPI00174A3217|nr:hypothetical protein [Nocardioides flavus (ex Wang et al. 2016)]
MAGLMTSPGAVADTGSFSDPARDVRAGADVLSVEVTNERRVAVVVRHRDLRRPATPAVSVMVDMYPNRLGPELSVDLNIYELYVWRVRRWQVYGDVPIACPVTGGFDYRADLTRVVMTRSGDCLRPRGPVRVSVAAFGRSGTDWAPGRHRFFPWVRRF